METWSENEP
jgi:WD40 repeat protein